MQIPTGNVRIVGCDCNIALCGEIWDNKLNKRKRYDITISVEIVDNDMGSYGSSRITYEKREMIDELLYKTYDSE